MIGTMSGRGPQIHNIPRTRGTPVARSVSSWYVNLGASWWNEDDRIWGPRVNATVFNHRPDAEIVAAAVKGKVVHRGTRDPEEYTA